jgi:RNA polymerase sigma factor (sigma-70 family)
MSPFAVRRYRAERLLRDEFEGLRKRVIGGVSQRLRAVGARLDASDLDACYSQAWQGLYAAVLDGAQIDNPAAWLALVTYRRAIDEHRSRRALSPELREHRARLDPAPTGVVTARAGRQARDCDIAAQLDDQARLRQLFEALRVRLSKREQQAATLCYLQGLSRADAAARMGVSESRMRKLMEGRGDGSPGVAAKVGALVYTIGAGEWCEQQGSLMRALAYGVLDPEGERYRVALLHRDACPACRAYVLSLRGLAAVLPPAPLMLHWGARRRSRHRSCKRRRRRGHGRRRRRWPGWQRRGGNRRRRRPCRRKLVVRRRPARRKACRRVPAGARCGGRLCSARWRHRSSAGARAAAPRRARRARRPVPTRCTGERRSPRRRAARPARTVEWCAAGGADDDCRRGAGQPRVRA